MAAEASADKERPWTVSARFFRSFAGPDKGPLAGGLDPDHILPEDQRRAAMNSLDPLEVKWSSAGLILSALVAIGVAVYLASAHATTKNGKATVTVAPDAYLIGGVVLAFCVIGFIALRARKRTIVAFSFFVIGLALTLVLLPLGLGLVVLGGWLMLRAFRINKYGTPNSKAVAREAAASRSSKGRERATTGKTTAKKASKATATPRGPSANKRYTPKSPPRKKIPKPTE